ncbi:uncharacterized protein LOC117186939 [Drosophila miranda]|uniref:uncharacterized protein LOC117186939 n=1 Tax=Drosophila miranda TaxID=7229 RepID=UPI00143F2C71|nr:uncharacterized protein LOC117186939 [Drosophila miranda]XP_033244227.1 uncharacterized protein LOC117186939 [Drosophila miranda]XP_033244228.1 uncharacterized protein LOC117186939 [Drosophila miranda]XP_033244229.1 uncharacterized protein LOC117186939 [Drosophila miranda]
MHQKQKPQPKKKPILARRGGCNSNSNRKLLPQKTMPYYSKPKPAEALSFQQLRDKNDDDLSSTSSSSSTFSSSSPQQESSVDYEAEDENEDKQRRPKHKDENESLLHVQNFLKCFGPNALSAATITATPATGGAEAPTPTGSQKVEKSPSTELRSWRQNYRNTIQLVPTTNTIASIATTAIATATTPTLLKAQPNHKPQKFQINTKFLRKPRNKLMKMLPTTTTTDNGTTTTIVVPDEEKHEQQTREKLQQQQQLPQLFNDDSNAKFKDFSIDSLLNK